MSVGIGGSFLGPLFVHTALQTGKLLSYSVLGFLETSMLFKLICLENIADLQIQKQRMCERPTTEIVSVYFEASSLSCFK